MLPHNSARLWSAHLKEAESAFLICNHVVLLLLKSKFAAAHHCPTHPRLSRPLKLGPAVQLQAEKVQGGPVGDALLVLPLDFSEVCRKLKKAGMPSLGALAAAVVEACHEAGVEYGFGQPHIKHSILEQADVLSAELAEALKVAPKC